MPGFGFRVVPPVQEVASTQHEQFKQQAQVRDGMHMTMGKQRRGTDGTNL
jgi:hypothetical protein